MIGKDLVKKKLLEYRTLEIKIHNGKEVWKSKSRPKLANNNDLEILVKYNNEIRGLYNYFSLAENCSSLSNFGYIMKYSMYKTFAQKYRTKVSKILKKYKRNGHFSVEYRLKSGVVKDLTLYHDGFKKKDPMRFINMDNLPKLTYYSVNTSLVKRLNTEKCEMCGKVDKLVMHHVRKLKDLKGINPLEKHMIARKRKTIALCGNCLKITHQNE
jgi:ribosomal protein S27AE